MNWMTTAKRRVKVKRAGRSLSRKYNKKHDNSIVTHSKPIQVVHSGKMTPCERGIGQRNITEGSEQVSQDILYLQKPISPIKPAKNENEAIERIDLDVCIL